ncbi:hypothetical protein SCALM49S_01164 [Streptomyces californicus]
MSAVPQMSISGIKQVLPHRYPMLLVDRVDELVPGERLTARKAVTANEPWYQDLGGPGSWGNLMERKDSGGGAANRTRRPSLLRRASAVLSPAGGSAVRRLPLLPRLPPAAPAPRPEPGGIRPPRRRS